MVERSRTRAAEREMDKQRSSRGLRVWSAAIDEYLSQLAALDLRLLHWLLRYPFQRADDLVIAVARWASRPTVYRPVSPLPGAALIASVLPPTPTPRNWPYFFTYL